MKKSTAILSVACGLLFIAELPAQTAPDAAVAASVQAMNDGLKFRADLVAAIVGGTDKSAPALARLKQQDSPSGLKIDADADFAYAAIDIGQRLIAAGKADEAEKFFKEAEKSLDGVVKKTPDASAPDKAFYLRKLAHIRGRYLNKVAEAKTDLEQAIALQPEDKGLQRVKEDLAKENAEHFKDKPKG